VDDKHKITYNSKMGNRFLGGISGSRQGAMASLGSDPCAVFVLHEMFRCEKSATVKKIILKFWVSQRYAICKRKKHMSVVPCTSRPSGIRPRFKSLLQEKVTDFSPKKKRNIGIHVCRGFPWET